MLPPGKKAFVLSLDDTCYYHSYDNHGIASRIVLGEDGKPTCEYIQDDGTVVTEIMTVCRFWTNLLRSIPMPPTRVERNHRSYRIQRNPGLPDGRNVWRSQRRRGTAGICKR